MKIPTLTTTLLLSLLPLVPACGGGGGGDDAPLTTQVSFPSSVATTDASTVTVRGRTTGSAAAVRVDGVDAQSTDGFRNWSAVVPLSSGPNALEIEVEDGDGNVFLTDVLRVRRDVSLMQLSGADFDAERGVVYVVDPAMDALLVVDPDDGTKQIVSGPGVGPGAPLHHPVDVVAKDAHTVYVLESLFDALFEIDNSNGVRTLLNLSGDPINVDLSDGGVDIDPFTGQLVVAARNGLFVVDLPTNSAKRIFEPQSLSERPHDVAIDPMTGTVYVLFLRSVQRVDLATGVLTPVSNESGVGKGDSFSYAASLDVDPKSGRLWVVNSLNDTVLEIDPTTGDRKLVFAGAEDGRLVTVTFDQDRGRALVGDTSRASMYSIDASDYSAEVVFGGVGSGPGIRSLADLEVRQGRIFGLDNAPHLLVEIERQNGDRRRVPAPGISDGDSFEDVTGLAMDEDAGIAYVADVTLDAIFRGNPETGSWNEVADADQPGGFENPRDLELLPDGRLLILDNTVPGLFVFDPETSTQTALSVNGDAKGPDFGSVHSLLIDVANGRALVTDDGAAGTSIKTVHLETGERGFLVNEDPSANLFGMALDPATGDLYVANVETSTVARVSPADGSLVTITGAGIGRGPALEFAQSLAFDETSGSLLTFLHQLEGLVAIDVTSGDRVIVSK